MDLENIKQDFQIELENLKQEVNQKLDQQQNVMTKIQTSLETLKVSILQNSETEILNKLVSNMQEGLQQQNAENLRDASEFLTQKINNSIKTAVDKASSDIKIQTEAINDKVYSSAQHFDMQVDLWGNELWHHNLKIVGLMGLGVFIVLIGLFGFYSFGKYAESLHKCAKDAAVRTYTNKQIENYHDDLINNNAKFLKLFKEAEKKHPEWFKN